MAKETANRFDLRVKRTKSGLGLVSFSAIKKGETVIEYVGHRIHKTVGNTPRNRYVFSVNRAIDIDGSPRWNTARYINHSCRPNCEAVERGGRIFIVAKRDIKPNEELGYDYGKGYFDEYIKPFGCRCEKHLAA